MSSTVDVIVDKMKDAKEVYKDLKAEQKKKMGLVMRDLRRDVPATVAKAVRLFYRNVKRVKNGHIVVNNKYCYIGEQV